MEARSFVERMQRSLILLCFVLISMAAFSKPAVSHYDLKYRFDFKERKLFCTATLSLTNLKQDDTLHLLLYRLLNIKSIKDELGSSIPFQQTVTSFSDWESFQVNAIEVFAGNIPIGKTENKLLIEYEGYLFGYTETGMSYVKDNINPAFTILRMDSYAYPVQGTPSWKEQRAAGLSYFDYKVSVAVPDSLTVVNGGRLVSKSSSEGTAMYVYENLKPAWRIDIAIGKYATIVDSGFFVHYFPEDSVGANLITSQLKKAYALYSEWFGNIPFDGYSIIEIPDGWGSQTDVTCIIQTAAAFKSEDKLYELYHELSHVWNVAATDKYPCRLESEGLAVFLQYLMMEKLHQKQGALDVAAEKTFKWIKKKLATDSFVATTPIMLYGEKQLTDWSYTKGMLFFYVLYKTAGEQAFMDTIKGYYAHYRATGATVEDFSAYLTTTLKGDKVKTIVSDWIQTDMSSQNILKADSLKDIL